MRHFYEVWEPVINRSPAATDLIINENLLLVANRQPAADDFDWNYFLQIGFSHHMEILFKAKTLEARPGQTHQKKAIFCNFVSFVTPKGVKF